ncbi:MAG TPA: YihY/virulence factor BrkB family protein [Solirubrobacteraceae bacterium]|jgi:membrane protein|nr:YihY/virulence factor BrkB family protein [Solirubrobacteraceae bacterium]
MRLGARVRRAYSALDEHEILNSASAIAFQVLFALVPLGLFTVALLGFLELDRVWEDAAAEIEPKVSPAAFSVMDDTVRRVLAEQQPFWLTAGAALAIWRLSAAMRAAMGALDRIYECEDGERSLVSELRTSIGLSLVTTVLMLLALAVIHLGPLVVEVDGAVANVVSIVVRWAVGLGLGVLAFGVVIHYGPARGQPLGWVSRGTVLCASAWLLATFAFAFYVTELADYGSVFGSFATVFLLLTYLYLSAAAFLAGVEIDVRARASRQLVANVTVTPANTRVRPGEIGAR